MHSSARKPYSPISFVFFFLFQIPFSPAINSPSIMELDDPFASIAEFCQISLSQQDQLSRCRFAGEPEDDSLSSDDSGGTPVESTGIVMLSVPDSPEGNENDGSTSRDNDVFHTPPEESYLAVSEEQQPKNEAAGGRHDPEVEGVADNGNSVGVDCDFMDDARAVDLGTDADLGFSAEMEVTERIELDSGSQSSFGTNQINDNKVILFEPDNFRIKEGELGQNVLGETPAKKLKISDETLGLNTPKPWLGAEVARVLERVAKSIEKLTSPSNNSKLLDEDVVAERSQDSSFTKILNSAHTAKILSFEGPSPESSFNLLHNQPNKNVNCSDLESQGDRCVVRKLQFHSARLEPRIEENEADLGDNEDIAEGYETEEIEEESEMEGNKEVLAANEDRTEAETGTEEIEDNKTEKLCSTDETSPGVNSLERQTDRVAKSIEDLDKFRYVRPTGPKSSGKDKDFRVKSSLPASNSGEAQGEGEMASTSNNKEMTIFDVLRELAKDYTFDPALAKLSVLEAARRGGMTFP